ncbi:SET domain-containing protein [Artemisia annua]|uniref:SET domain-containing protein n=1 Tax=Artemisia annua TaxID=35608 RepID=A0A2U1QAF7_ARTAN|nr:SET domain-containing protein [Artemisia annua]
MLNLYARIQRPLFASSRRCFHISCNLNTSSHPLQLVDNECNDLLPWLRHKSGAEITSHLSIGKSSYGWSLFASKPIQAGDCMLKVPHSVQLTQDNLPPKVSSLLGKDVSNTAKLALVILLHQKLGQASEWAPYISCLPPVEEMHNTIFWSDEELETIKISYLYNETLKHKDHIENEFSSIQHIPIAEHFNHDASSELTIASIEQVSKFIAGKNYAPGDEVLIKYDDIPNAPLLLHFGFIIPSNKYNTVQVEINLPQHDQLLEMKLDLLNKHKTLSLKYPNKLDSRGIRYMVKEVKSSIGKGRGIPQGLQLQDLALEATQNDGRLTRIPLKNRTREMEAHQFLNLRFNDMIENYNAALEDATGLRSPRWGASDSQIWFSMAEKLLRNLEGLVERTCSTKTEAKLLVNGLRSAGLVKSLLSSITVNRPTKTCPYKSICEIRYDNLEAHLTQLPRIVHTRENPDKLLDTITDHHISHTAMLILCVRIQRPFFATPLRCFRISCNINTSSSYPQQPADNECNDFLPWLRRKSGAEISSQLTVGKSSYGWSLFACEPIQAGDCILKVPYSVQLAPDNLHPKVSSLLGADVGNVAKLALVILLHQKLGQASEWAPYILWSNEELEMIKISSLYDETLKHKAQIEKDFSSIKHVLDRFPEYFDDVTLHKFKHAYNLDFFNHNAFSETDVLSDDFTQFSEVIADENYAPGDEVLIRYGKFSNNRLLLDFGFIFPSNKYDKVHVEVDVPQHDHLCAMKLDLLDRHTTPALRDVNELHSSGNCFMVMEVKSSSGKGRGIPQALRAFARVVCCTSHEELQDLSMEATQNDGRLARIPLKNRVREMEAHQFLHSRFDHMIEKRNAALQSLARHSSPPLSGKHTQRMQLARDFLTGELQILISASTWLKNYCKTLKH